MFEPVQPGAPGTTGYNLYTYSANNPTTFTDPTGQAVLAEDGFLRSRALPAVRGFAARNPVVFGCIRDALIGSAFELGTVAATSETFSAGRLAGTAGVDCTVGGVFGGFRATSAFDALGFGGRRATTFLEGFSAVGLSDTLFRDGFNLDRALLAGTAGAVLDGLAEVVGARLVSGNRAGVALDNNAIVAAIDEGQEAAVDLAIAGRQPLVSSTVVSEFLAGGNTLDTLRLFLRQRGGRITSDASQSALDDLQRRLDALNATLSPSQQRSIGANDLCIAATACELGVPLITNDSRLFRALDALGIPVEGF